jgi:hypothetical protein
MKIEAGKYYRTRGGDVAGPMRRTTDQFWYSNYRTWNEDGGIFSSGAAHGLDLISEVYISDTPPDVAPAPEAKTLRDEFAMVAVASCAVGPQTYRDAEFPETAAAAYAFADAMMEARKK